MEITNADNQALNPKNKIEVFFKLSIQNRKQKGFCITKDIMAVIMDKWSLFIIYNLGYYEILRFGELKSNIKGICSRMLSVTLKKLENNGIVKRSVYAEVPPKVEYNLTRKIHQKRNKFGEREFKPDLGYSGEWKNNKRSGYGSFTWESGQYFEGNWENNMRNGEGTLTFINKQYLKGVWKNDSLNGEAVLYSPEGIELQKSIYSKNIKI